MKKLILIMALFLSAAPLCHAEMTTDEITSTMKSLYEDRKELKSLAEQRQAEEQALMQEYKVDECNQKRSSIIAKYQALQQAVIERSRAKEDILGQK